jgi:hypothetical protein
MTSLGREERFVGERFEGFLNLEDGGLTAGSAWMALAKTSSKSMLKAPEILPMEVRPRYSV